MLTNAKLRTITCTSEMRVITQIGVPVKSTLIVAGMIGFASAGGLAVAAPASADCSPSFTSIPCTIATNVAAAPVTTAAGLAAAPGQLVGGLASTAQVAGIGCPTDSTGATIPCGLPAVPGQFLGSGLTQIVTAPVAIGGALASAPFDIAGGLAAAPGQFLSAIQNGGTAPTP
jgi:hypothetical protein